MRLSNPHVIKRLILLDGEDVGLDVGRRDGRWDLIHHVSVIMCRFIIRLIRGLAIRDKVDFLHLVPA